MPDNKSGIFFYVLLIWLVLNKSDCKALSITVETNGFVLPQSTHYEIEIIIFKNF